jgi:HEAT repeat protein
MRSVLIIVGLVYIATSAACFADVENKAKAAAEAADKWVFAVVNVIDTQTELRKKLKKHGGAAYDVLSKLYDSKAVNFLLRDKILETMVEIDPSRATKFIETNVFVKGPRNQKSTASFLLGKIASPESIKLLIRQFDAKDRRDRANARQAMNRTKGAALNEILKTLVNGSDVARTEAALCIADLTLYGQMMDSMKARIIKAAAERLNDPCPDVRRALTRCMRKYDKAGFKGCLQNEDIVIRLAAFTSIRSMRDHSYPNLVIQAANDPNSEVRSQVAMSLRKLNTEHAAKTLLAMHNDEYEQVLIHARKSLIWRKENIQEKMIQPLLTDSDPENRVTAVALLAKCDPPPIKQILAIARNEKSDAAMRKAATNRILVHAKNPLVLDFVRELFENPNHLKWANGYRQFQPWPFSIGRTVCDKSGTGTGTALALIQHGDTKDAVRIVNSIRDGHIDPWICGLLHDMGNKAIPALKIAIKLENVAIRQAALSSLVRFATNKEAIKLVRSALKDEDANVRGHAAVLLGYMGDADSIDTLAGLLKDEIEYARGFAATALVMLGDKRGEKIAFDWHKKQLKSFSDYNSWLFLLKYAIPLGSTKQRAAEIFSIPKGTNGQGNHWSYYPNFSMIISLKFKDGILVETFPAEKELKKTSHKKNQVSIIDTRGILYRNNTTLRFFLAK